MEYNLNAWRTITCVKNYFFNTLKEVHKILITPHCGNADQYHILQKLIRGKPVSNKERLVRSALLNYRCYQSKTKLRAF
jgi:hypothetical protein